VARFLDGPHLVFDVSKCSLGASILSSQGYTVPSPEVGLGTCVARQGCNLCVQLRPPDSPSYRLDLYLYDYKNCCLELGAGFETMAASHLNRGKVPVFMLASSLVNRVEELTDGARVMHAGPFTDEARITLIKWSDKCIDVMAVTPDKIYNAQRLRTVPGAQLPRSLALSVRMSAASASQQARVTVRQLTCFRNSPCGALSRIGRIAIVPA